MVDQKSPTYRPRRAFIEPDAEPAKPNPSAGPAHGNGEPIPAPVFDEEQPKPLYRDETRSNGWSAAAARAAPVPQADPPNDQTVRPTTSAPPRTRAFDG